MNGKRWYAAGTNAFYAAQYDLFTTAQVDTMLQVGWRRWGGLRGIACAKRVESGSASTIDPVLTPPHAQMHAANGTTVLRVFAFTDGYGTQENVLTPNPIQPRLGVYNETVARRWDRAWSRVESGISELHVLTPPVALLSQAGLCCEQGVAAQHASYPHPYQLVAFLWRHAGAWGGDLGPYPN